MSAPVRPPRGPLPRRPHRPAARLAAPLGLIAVPTSLVLLAAPPASAEELVVTITSQGVQPQVLVARAGDTVRFVNEDRTFAYRAQSTTGPWSFDSGPTTLLTSDFTVPEPLTRPGTYAYRVAQDPPYRGTVLLGGGTPTAPRAVPSAPGAATPGSASPASPAVTATGDPSGGAVPSLTPASPVPSASVGPAPVSGALPAPPSQRALGLPTAVAAVLVVGAGSLLLRLLLAEPAADDRRAAR